MSTIQVANIWLESTGNTRIQYLGSNNLSLVANGSTLLTINNFGMSVNGAIQASYVFVNAKTDNYTLANSDSGSVITVNNTAIKTITVPNTVPVGYRVMVTMIGTGNVTIANAAGITLASRTGAYTLTTQYSSASIFLANSSLAIVDGAV